MTMQREAATPPALITTEEVLRRMRSGIKEVFEITCREFVLPVRILTLDELTSIRREAIRKVALVQGDETDRNVFIQKAVLKIASQLDKGAGPTLNDNMLAAMTMGEIQHLYAEYSKISDDVNPEMESLSQDQFRALIDAVKKNAIVSKDCSLRQLRAIFTAYQDLIQRLDLQTSQADNLSGGQL